MPLCLMGWKFFWIMTQTTQEQDFAPQLFDLRSKKLPKDKKVISISIYYIVSSTLADSPNYFTLYTLLEDADFIRLDTRFDSDCELVFGVGEPVVEYEGCESSSDAVSFPVVSPEAFIFPRVLPRSTSDDVDTRFPIALL